MHPRPLSRTIFSRHPSQCREHSSALDTSIANMAFRNLSKIQLVGGNPVDFRSDVPASCRHKIESILDLDGDLKCE